MAKKLIFLISFLLLSNLCQAELITLFRPAASKTKDSSLLVEGRVEDLPIRHLQLRVDPFIDGAPTSQVIPVENGYFRAKVELSPGLNIISLSTLSGKHRFIKPILLLRKKQPGIGEFGKKASVFFTSPEALRASPPLFVKGVVTDPSIKKIEVAVMSIYESLPQGPDRFLTQWIKKGIFKGITYREVEIKDMNFSFPVEDLSEGLNMIVAKPAGLRAGYEDVQLKVVLHEIGSKQIILQEPVLSDNKVVIKGRMDDPSIKKAMLGIYALVEEKGEESIRWIAEEQIKIKKNGVFELKVGLGKGDYIIKSSPTVVITAPGVRASRTLIKWW